MDKDFSLEMCIRDRPQSVRRKSHETAVDLIRKKHTSSAYSMISEEGLKREPILNIS